MAIQTLIIAALMVTPSSTVTVVPANPPQRVGDCLSSAGISFDLEKLLFIETESVIVQGPVETFRITIEGEHVRIADLKPKRDGIYITNIAYEVAPRDDLDVKLKLAFISGDFVLYWKETFEHQIYRQGLFRFVKARPFALCEGKGGSTSYE